jgi:hypothetical protein
MSKLTLLVELNDFIPHTIFLGEGVQEDSDEVLSFLLHRVMHRLSDEIE